MLDKRPDAIQGCHLGLKILAHRRWEMEIREGDVALGQVARGGHPLIAAVASPARQSVSQWNQWSASGPRLQSVDDCNLRFLQSQVSLLL